MRNNGPDFDLKDVYTTISLMPNMIQKAYVTFILSSGLKTGEAQNLTIDDLIKACESEFYSFEEKSLINLLSKNPESIVPMWVLNTNKGKKITFSSSESSFYLFLYLKDRLLKTGKISGSEKLFVTGNSGLDNSQLTTWFDHTKKLYLNNRKDYLTAINNKNMNKELNYGFLKDYGFTSENLKKYFEKTCNFHFPEFESEIHELEKYVKKENHPLKKRKLVKLFTEGLAEDDKYFLEFTKNQEELKSYYNLIHPHLTAKNYDKIFPKRFTAYPEYDKYLLEKYGDSFIFWDLLPLGTNSIIEEKTADKEYSETDIRNILYNYLLQNGLFNPYDQDEKIKGISRVLLSESKRENELGLFSADDCCLDRLVQISYIKWYIKEIVGIKRQRVGKFENQTIRKKIILQLEAKDVFVLFRIDKEDFDKALLNNMKIQKEKGETPYINYDIIGNLIHELLYQLKLTCSNEKSS